MRGILKFNEPLAPYTSWHIGGPAETYYRPADLEDLAQFLKSHPADRSLTWLGLGSNVLVSDQGIRGTVIHLLYGASSKTNLNQAPQLMEKEDLVAAALTPFDLEQGLATNQKIIRVEAGMPCAKFAKFCAKHGMLRGGFFAGIPGTIGGALAMNAGAWGEETWDHVCLVEIINRQGERSFRQPKEYQLGYRTVIAEHPDEWFIAGYFQLTAGDADQSTAKIKALLKQRQLTQPIGSFSCGSVFRNPLGDYAGRLIEASGLKGTRIGNAEVSSKHANFILNGGEASAEDVRQLIELIQRVVVEKHQIELHTEVKMLGF
jgi:UDP-N-acetylmuramate dehydrogenase